MSKSQKYVYVGSIGKNKRTDFPLICGCCGRDTPIDGDVYVYFDNGPGDFFLVDGHCRKNIDLHDDKIMRNPALSRR